MRKKAASLVLTLIVMSIIAILSSFILTRTGLTYKIYKNQYFVKQAFYLAQSGIYLSRAYLKTINWYTSLVYTTDYNDESKWRQLIPTDSSKTYLEIDGNRIRVLYFYNPNLLSKDTIILRSYGISKTGALKEIEATLKK